ncbi:uncharacterized protein LOC118403399 [Branchiostoma floridae]|nr:uncharacterized protein LOC118403399 [Branchiostoma floridae]
MKRSDRTTLSEIKALGCKGKESADLSGITIQVPSIPPSSQRYCNVIDIIYKLKFIVNIPGPHKDLEVDVPITIGSIPLRSYYPLAPSFPSQPEEQPTSTDPSLPPPPYYAVSSTGPVKIKDDEEKAADKNDMGEKEFAPKYAYYDWSKHT